jgi:hypothetical protein
METYWCSMNNSIIDNFLKTDFNPALVPAPNMNARNGENGKVVA